MRRTDALACFAAALTVVAACRSSAMPEPSADAAAAASAAVQGSASASVEVQPTHRSWPSKTATDVLQLRVRALTCQGCAWQIGETLAKDDGIADVASSVPDKLVTVRYDRAKTSPARIKAALADVGYETEDVP